ncbi:MAG: DEAD/DEAH box helicase, partial [Cyanobacteria bacterium REEB65]|nr:DEAD/DEAH box helicase [Cyanobacteria bacterium REEB65]
MTDYRSSSSFGGLGLSDEWIESLDRNGIREPLEVQRRAIPLVLAGKDLLVQSRTGTGKTLAFVLPLLQRIDSEYGVPQALVVAPTRELANQVGAVFARMGRASGIRVATLTGGVPYGEQLKALRHGVHVVVGTPGRLCDHLDRRTLNLQGCDFVALDEADEILDMGFQEDLEKILDGLPARRQTLLFSATLAEEIERLAHRYMRQPERLSLSSGMKAAVTLHHVVCEVNRAAKYESLVNLLHVEQPDLALVFCHTKLDTEDLARRLLAEGFRVGCLNGNLAQAVRSSTLESFRQHEIRVLVATDVAARGIDVR